MPFENLVNKAIEDMKRSQGVEAAADPILIDERKQGHGTYRFEIQPEMWKTQPALRFMRSTFSSSSNERHRKTFGWPIQGPRKDLKHIADSVLAALEPNAEKLDHRCWLWAYITEDNQQGQLVILYHEREKKSPMSITLPVDTYRVLQQKLESGNDF